MKFDTFIRAAVVAVVAASVGSSAQAQEGQNLRKMPCSEAQALVKTKGAAVLHSGPNIFNRYVKDAAFCAEDMVLKPAWAKTQNVQACFVGYICTDNNNE